MSGMIGLFADMLLLCGSFELVSVELVCGWVGCGGASVMMADDSVSPDLVKVSESLSCLKASSVTRGVQKVSKMSLVAVWDSATVGADDVASNVGNKHPSETKGAEDLVGGVSDSRWDRRLAELV